MVAFVDTTLAAVALSVKDTTLIRRKHLAELAKDLHMFLIGIIGLIAVAVPPTLGEIPFEGVKTAPFFDKAGDVNLSTNEVAYDAFIVV